MPGRLRFRIRRAAAQQTFRFRNSLALVIGLAITLGMVVVWERFAYWIVWSAEPASPTRIMGVDFSIGYEWWHDTRGRALIFDHSEQLMGLYPVIGESDSYAGDHAQGSYVTAHALDVPDHWWQMVRLLEDGNRDRWFHFNGIDLSQFLKIPYRYFVSGAGLTGGSTLEMQLIKTMNRDTDVSGFSLLVRKLRDILHAPLLSFHFKRHADHSVKDWYAHHVPLLRHGNEHGLAAASYLLFNTAPKDLTLAEQALLAAATRHRLGIDGRRNWGSARERGAAGLQRLHENGVIDARELEESTRELASLTMPPSLLVSQGESAPCGGRPVSQLKQLGHVVSRGEFVQADAELRRVFGRGWWRDIGAVRLTLDMEQNCRARDKVDKVRENSFTSISSTLANRDRNGGVYVTAAMADEEGRIVRFYSDPHLPFYHHLGWSDGSIVVTDSHAEQRQIGSVGKLLVSALAGAEGDSPDDEYFVARREKRIAGMPRGVNQAFQNFTGETGFTDRSEYGALVSARSAFARSNNLAMMQRLTDSTRDQQQLAELVKDFGLILPADHHAGTYTDLVVDIPMGNIRGSPNMMHRVIRAIQSGIAGDLRGACSPHLVHSVQRIGKGDVVNWDDLMPDSRVCRRVKETYMAESSQAQFVRDVLSGVVECDIENPRGDVCDRTPSSRRGTAASNLGQWSASSLPDALRWHVAKTGTTSVRAERVSTQRASTRSAMVAGGFALADDRRYTYVAEVGARGDRTSTGIGSGVYGGDIARLMRPLINEVVPLDGSVGVRQVGENASEE